MPVGLKQQEEELKLLIKKVDSEIAKFERLRAEIGAKKEMLEKSVIDAGLQPIPVNISPHPTESTDLEYDIRQHLLNLNKIKNFINGKLNVVIKEEELLAELEKAYGKKVGIRRLSGGEFELIFSDSKTQGAFNELQKSKKILSAVKQSIQKLTNEEL
jgi:hypothetical protein